MPLQEGSMLGVGGGEWRLTVVRRMLCTSLSLKCKHLKRATAENINGVILPKFRWLAIVHLSDSQSFEIIFCQNA